VPRLVLLTMARTLLMAGAAVLLTMQTAITCGAAFARGYHYTNPYFRSDGAYVQPHDQTNPNGNPNDNWSTRVLGISLTLAIVAMLVAFAVS
jgi:hypothetical protein